MKSVWLGCLGCLFCGGAWASQVEVTYTFKDRHEEKKLVAIEPDTHRVFKFSVCRSALPPDVQSVAVLPDFAVAHTDEEGYFVMPNGHLGAFRQREGIARLWASCMPMFGMKTPRMTFVAIVTGMPYSYSLIARAKDGVYRFGPVFDRGLDRSDEDIAVEFHTLTGAEANYAGMARVYRQYQLDRNACVPLRERIKHSPELAYAARCPEVRIRQGWKPVPSPVPEQTVKNEPPMRVMVTFDRVGDILDEFQRQGVDAAEICLVGWNQKGHDGCWPQIFPVEESLGGEAKLRAVIKKAQQMGYQIVGHANHIDAYLIADCWDAEYIRKNSDGTLPRGKTTWGGGRVYTICAQRAYERFAVKDTPMIAALGFRGLHYLDVFTCVPPAPCGDPRHPATERRTAFFIDQIMKLGKETFGGIASEGPYDFCCGNLDSVLYVSFDKPDQPMPKMVDRCVPIWQLVYNGIILSTPFTTTVNYTTQNRVAQLKLIEFNGRPVFYFYSRFKDDGKNWMGEGDLGCTNDTELCASVAKIKRGYDEFRRLWPLQLEFMEQHEQLAPSVFRTAFSDGSEIITNYGSAAYSYKSALVGPMDYSLIRRPQAKR
jgi:hypothetical protein